MSATLAQRYAVTADQLDRRIHLYRDSADSHMAAYLTSSDLLSVPHSDLAGMLAVAIRRAVRRQNGLRSVRRRAVRRAREWQARLVDAEITRDDALDERDALRAAFREVMP